MRNTIAVITSLILALALLTACSTQSNPAQLETPAATETPVQTIPPDVIDLIATAIDSATTYETSAFCYQKEGGLYVNVRIDPMAMTYIFAYDLEPTVVTLQEMIDEYNIELCELDFSGAVYKNGEVYNSIHWVSSDLSVGKFVNPREGYVNDSMTIHEVFDYCEYTSGEYKGS